MPTAVTPIRTPLESSQSAIQAVLDREAPPGTLISNKPSNPKEAALAIKYEMENGTIDNALEKVRAWKEPLNTSEILNVLDENFGTERSIDGKKIRPAASPSEMRYNQSQRTLLLMDKMLTVGFDKLTDGRGSEKQIVIDAVDSALSRIPQVKGYLDGINRIPYAAILKIIRNPAYATNIRSLIEGRVLGENGEGIKLPENVSDKKVAEEEAKAQKELAEEAKNEVDTELTRVTKGLEDFRTPDPLAGIIAGSRYDDIDPAKVAETQDKIVRKSVEIQDLENKKNSYNLQIGTEKKKSGGGDPAVIDGLLEKIKIADEDIATKKTDLANLNADKEKQKKAQEDLKNLQNEKRQLTVEQREKQKAFLEADKNLHLAKNNLAKAVAEREHAEARFSTGINDILSQAAIDTFEDEVEKAVTAQNTLVEKAKAEAKSDEEKAILQAIIDRYEETKTIHPPFSRSRIVRRPNRPNIRKDFELLIDTPNGGPEAIMRQILNDAKVDGTRIDNAMNDPEFIKKVQPQLLQRLVARRLQVGKMRESDVRLFVESDWGAGVIDAAIAKNKEVGDMVQQFRDNGQVSGSFINFLRHSRAGSRLSWIALILGLLPLAAVAGGANYLME